MEFNKYSQYLLAHQYDVDDKERVEKLFARLLPFEDAKDIEEAQQIAKTILPTKMEFTSFYVGNAKCSIINKKNLFRVCVDSAHKFVCYDFTKTGV